MKKTFIALLALAMIGCNQTAAPKDDHAHEEAGHDEHGHEEEAPHTDDITLTPEAAKIAGIKIGEAQMLPMQSELKVAGSITNTATGKALVTPPVAGRITRLFVKVGDTVNAGQPIAILESADLADASAGIVQAQSGVMLAEAAVRESSSQVDLANARLRTARTSLDRQKAFAKTGAFSQPALQTAQKDLADAESEMERGKQDQLVHEAQLERAERLYKQELISRTELEQARLEVATDKIRQSNAERRIELAKATFEREQRIAQQGLANSREIQSAEAEVRSAALEVEQAKIRRQSAISGVASAKKGLQAARTGYSVQSGNSRGSGGTLTVVAPIGGVVTERAATLGQAVERTSEICEIENLKSIWATANVPEKHIALARKGSTAKVRVAAYPDRVFNGTIQVVESRLDPKTRTMPVQVLVENNSGVFRADMFATISLGIRNKSNALAIPRTAIVQDGDRQVVYIAEDGGKYEEKAVTTGRTQGDLIEIVTGLEPGAKIVIAGAFVLKSEKVKAGLKGHEH